MPIKNNQGSDNIPLLRFPEFQGEWEKKKLELIGEYIGGGTPDTSIQEYWEGNIPWISSSDIIENHIHNINIQKYITDEAIKNSATKKIPANSLIIVSRVGVGKFAINKMVVCTSQDFTNIVVNTKIFDPNFTAYNLYKNIDILYNISQGTSIKGFTTVDLKKSEISFPTLSEQTKIASFLTAVDEKIQALKKKHSLLEQYKKGVMQKLFSQETEERGSRTPLKNNKKGEQLRFKDEDGNDFPEWEVKKLGEIATITTGSSNREDSILDGEFTFFDRSQDIRTSNSYLFDKEAIIVPGEGQEFIPKYFIGKFDLHQRTYAIFDFGNINGKFLFYSITHNDKHLQSQAVGSTVKSLRLPMFETMPINLPCPNEQSKIADFLTTLDEKITQTQMQIEKTETWKKGLLQKMFC